MGEEIKKNQKIVETAPPINTKRLTEELINLEPTAVLEMFELDLGRFSGKIFRFHAGVVFKGDLIFNGNTFHALPVEVDQFEVKGDGTLPRPHLRIGNVDSVISNIMEGYDDFIGLKVKRIRTFLKFIDGKNFKHEVNPYGAPDPNARFPDDVYVINQKVAENKNIVEFELVSPLEMDTVKLPGRQIISNYCPWIYRGQGCSYGNTAIRRKERWTPPDSAQSRGEPIADGKDKEFTSSKGYGFSVDGNATWQDEYTTAFVDSGNYNPTGVYASGDFVQITSSETSDVVMHFVAKPTGYSASVENGSAWATFNNISGSDPRLDQKNWVQDQCSKTLSGCMLRFGSCNDGLPFGGFPGTDRFTF